MRDTNVRVISAFKPARNRRTTPQDNMLRDVLAEDNVRKKREIIKTYNQFHYIFGTALTRIQQEDLLTDVNNEGEDNDKAE